MPGLEPLLSARAVMSFGERAALEAVVSDADPALAVEIGTGGGGSLELIARHCAEVHAFDIRPNPELPPRFPNVTFHWGDSKELLPQWLAVVSAAGGNVDFALVDGDHSAHGVRTDVENLLGAGCVRRTAILLHDTLNDSVRAGLRQIAFERYERVTFVDLDFVPGRLFLDEPFRYQLWGGLGLVLVGIEVPAEEARYALMRRDDVFDTYWRSLEDRSTAGAVDPSEHLSRILELESTIQHRNASIASMEGSLSWRITRPLRRAREQARRLV